MGLTNDQADSAGYGTAEVMGKRRAFRGLLKNRDATSIRRGKNYIQRVKIPLMSWPRPRQLASVCSLPSQKKYVA
jgi:hypothetical protein